uniref:NADH dehydrogenase subunit 4 n=1 Tax=Plator insolens TaxID=2880587 RepID=UPI001F142789|nr:NADH dehydrogenase subunit 4 [Plator insolens]UMI39151.1 NADH dehydrogenase subunit 4 [Plator insolens]
MMKFITPSILMIFIPSLPSKILLKLSLILMFALILPSLPPCTNMIMLLDNLSLIMILLTLMSTILIILSSSHTPKIIKTIIPIFMILMLTFSMSNLLSFYILFELVLIPTIILIMMMGKQPERTQASIYLIMYTIFASLPLLTSIIMIKNNPSFILMFTSLYSFNIPILLMMAFLVKTPMFFTHLWLPKAHVEAPLEGSMILAAILLKLGGYGLIRFFPICIKNLNTLNFWVISISMIGATATSLNCIRQKDLKSLIAYSSVAHMGFVLTGIFTMNSMGLTGAIMMMIAHGMTSSALFVLVNDLYQKFSSRNILLFKSMITITPNITFWWFLFMMMNISAPPSINTISEIMLMSSLINWNNITPIMIFMMSLMTSSFSMMMFINISHNTNQSPSFPQTSNKTFLSLFIHLIPLLMMLMKMELMLY